MNHSYPAMFQFAGNNNGTLKHLNRRKWNSRQINRDANSFHQSVAATNDHYMRDALSKVKESKVTLPDELTRIHGTFTTTIK